MLRNIKTFQFLLRHRKTPVDRLFRASWRILEKRRSGTIIGKNIYNIPEVEILHYEYRQVFKYFFPAFSPTIVASDHSMLAQMLAKPCLIAAVHAYNEFAICKLLDGQGLQTAIVTHSPYDRQELANYNISKPPLNIPSTSKLFLDLRAAIRAGNYVVCDVDFLSAQKDGPQSHYVSLSAFQFHAATGLPLYFACNRVLNDGTIKCFTGKAEISKGDSPEVAALQFIAFIDHVQQRATKLAIGNWDELTKDKRHRYSMGKWAKNRVKVNKSELN